MTTQSPFAPNISKTKTINATSTSTSVTLDALDVQGTTSVTTTPTGGFSVMRIINKGPGEVFIRWGVGAQTAIVTTDTPMLPGTVELFTKATTVDTVAAITAGSDTATVRITCGEGQ